jgi:hypothetical protein
MLDSICPPALLYLGFSLTHIVIDIFKNMYNTAIMKFIVMIVFTLILNIICSSGLSIISWMLVFIPFILMTIITSMMLFVFGLSPSKGNIDYKVNYPQNEKKIIVVDNKNNNHNGNNSNNTEYNPDDFNSGTPDDINNYN